MAWLDTSQGFAIGQALAQGYGNFRAAKTERVQSAKEKQLLAQGIQNAPEYQQPTVTSNVPGGTVTGIPLTGPNAGQMTSQALTGTQTTPGLNKEGQRMMDQLKIIRPRYAEVAQFKQDLAGSLSGIKAKTAPRVVGANQGLYTPGQGFQPFTPPKSTSFNLTPGETHFENNQPVASLPPKPAEPTGMAKDFNDFKTLNPNATFKDYADFKKGEGAYAKAPTSAWGRYWAEEDAGQHTGPGHDVINRLHPTVLTVDDKTRKTAISNVQGSYRNIMRNLLHPDDAPAYLKKKDGSTMSEEEYLDSGAVEREIGRLKPGAAPTPIRAKIRTPVPAQGGGAKYGLP